MSLDYNDLVGAQWTPHRRRPSIISRTRPKSAMVGNYRDNHTFELLSNEWFSSGRPQTGTLRQQYQHQFDLGSQQWTDSPSFESLKPLPVLPPHKPRQQHTSSFSSFFSPNIRGLARRMSHSLRLTSKSSKEGLREFNGKHMHSRSTEALGRSGQYKQDNSSKSKGWFRSHRGPREGNRPSLDLLASPSFETQRRPSNTSPIPGHGSEPPVLPDEGSGSAARASAAAQNEMLGVGFTKSDLRVMDNRLPRDSESGIGIDMRDRSETAEESGVAVVRINPTEVLPSELTSQILSLVDSETLMNAELVSKDWYKIATDLHVWKAAFQREYGAQLRQANAHASRSRAAGLGSAKPAQDWKKMFLVRKALDYRWQSGKAAAIYLNGHKDSVYCVQFDENKIITGSRDQTIRVWDARTFQCLKIIGAASAVQEARPAPFAQHYTVQQPGRLPFTSITPPVPQSGNLALPQRRMSASEFHQASILCLQFDDEIMVTGSSDSTCIVWDIKNDYTPIRRLRGHRAGVLDVCFDERYIISCSKDTTLCIWDRRTGELLKRLSGHRGPVNAVQLRGDLVVSASGDGIAKLWNLTSGLCVKEFPSKDRGLACVEFSEDARTILAGGNDQVIYQFDANTGELVSELKGHKGLVRSLHLDSLNGRVVSGSYDMSVKVFDFETGDLIIDFPGWTTSWMLSAKSDYRRIVATSQDARAVIMDFGYGLDGVELLEA